MQTLRPHFAGCPVIIGGGLAGLMTALRLSPRPVILLAKVPLSEGAASAWAQGGIAAAVGEDDRPALHAADTLAAGDGLSDPAVAGRIAAAAPAAIIELERHGVVFDRDPAGRLALGLEAAHARRRSVHVAGDGTGAAIMRALVAAVQATPSITVIEGLEARRLLVDDRGIAGVLAAGPSDACLLPSRRVVLAHPECPPEVVAEADFAGSTAAMADYVTRERPGRVVLMTECSMSDNIAALNPGIDFVRPCNLCPHMKRITLPKIRRALETMQHEVTIDPAVAEGARRAVERMLAVR